MHKFNLVGSNQKKVNKHFPTNSGKTKKLQKKCQKIRNFTMFESFPKVFQIFNGKTV